jgi:hypothetical protein
MLQLAMMPGVPGHKCKNCHKPHPKVAEKTPACNESPELFFPFFSFFVVLSCFVKLGPSRMEAWREA